jgi:hypothetical protein
MPALSRAPVAETLRGAYRAPSRNSKKTRLQRSAASIGGKWPEPSNRSTRSSPPAAR